MSKIGNLHTADESSRLPHLLPKVQPRPGRSRRNLHPLEWQSRILHTARVLFADRGYDATTMEEVARLAGLSRARLYRFFPGRRELFDAILAEDAQSLAGELLLEVARASDVESKVRAVVTVFFRFVEQRHERNRILYSESSRADPALGELMRSVRSALADTLSQHLAVLLPSRTELDPGELRLVAHAVIAMAEGAAAAWASGPHLDRERSTEIVTRVALRALRLADEPDGDLASSM